jgi:Domain of unknown function (DUF1911)/Domain of unknown function (DUF1910)
VRDTVQTKLYFDEAIAFYQMVIDRDKGTVNDLIRHAGRAMQLYSLVELSCKLVVDRYSRGDDFKEMNPSVTQMGMMFKLKAQTMPTLTELTPEEKEMWANLGLGDFFDCTRCLSFVVGLRYSQNDIRALLEWIGHAGEDGLLDRIAVLLGDKDRPVMAHSKFEPEFDPLIEVMDAPVEERPALLANYVNTWYKRMKRASWHNTHKGEAYCGYWCFEAALVAMLLDVDDSAIADHIHYPVDLVKHYRAASHD